MANYRYEKPKPIPPMNKQHIGKCRLGVDLVGVKIGVVAQSLPDTSITKTRDFEPTNFMPKVQKTGMELQPKRGRNGKRRKVKSVRAKSRF